jgi:V8-like Glu-specific endopeptidase
MKQLSLLLITAAAVTGCTDDPLATQHAVTDTAATALTAEEQQYAADMEFFRKRREAFQATGKVPAVPPSLSENPLDPEYEFAGYMKIATLEEERLDDERVAANWPPKASREEVQSYSWTLEQELADGAFGMFVNDAGEKWRYRPRNLPSRLRALRLARGGGDVRNAPPHAGAPGPTGETSQGLTGVLGGDDRALRSQLSGHSMTSYPWRVFGALINNGDSTSAAPNVRCSGAKIGERYVLTSGHCVFTAGGGEDSLKKRDWWPGADGLRRTVLDTNPSPNGKKNVLWYYYSEHFVEDGWWSRDYSVLVLYDNESSCNLGSLGYRVDGSLAGQDTFNFGYPDEGGNCPGSPDPNDNCAGSLWGTEKHITRTEAPYIFYTHDATGGQSGSPVYDFNGGNRQILGVVQGTYTAVENRGIKIRDLVFDFIDTARDDHPSSVCDY